jgi:hypothetical protein
MAENKVDLSMAGGGGSREAGTGIGLAAAVEAKSGEAAFLDAAASQLENLGVLDGTQEEEPKRRKRKTEEAQDVEQLEEQADDELAAEEEEPEEGLEEEEQGEEAGSPEEAEDDEEDAKVSIRLNGKKASLEQVLDHVGATVVVNGEEVDVSGDELIKGYQRGKDYSDKTTELKRERDDLMPYSQMVAFAKQDPQFIEYVQSYFQNGPFPELANDPLIKTTDAQLAKLLDRNESSYDPEKAQQVIARRTEWQTKNADRQQINQRTQQEQQQMWNNWVGQQVTSATDAINGIGEKLGNQYKEGDEYSAKSPQVIEFLKASGYNENEISGQAQISTADARVAILAYKASEFDRMIRESDSPRVTLGKKRKKLAPPRSQKTGSGTKKAPSSRQRRDSFRKASKDQTSDSWVSAIEKRLGF